MNFPNRPTLIDAVANDPLEMAAMFCLHATRPPEEIARRVASGELIDAATLAGAMCNCLLSCNGQLGHFALAGTTRGKPYMRSSGDTTALKEILPTILKNLP